MINIEAFENIFLKEKNEKEKIFLIHRSYITHVKNKLQKTASTKTRSEVSGGGRKPWKQKGTGRARSGSNTSPLWKGGGVIFGPKPKIVIKKINRKEKQLALKFLLYSKKNNISYIQNFDKFSSSVKTNFFLKNLETLGLYKNQKIGIILPNQNKNIYLATKNLKNIRLMLVSSLNVEDLLKVNFIVTTNDVIETIKQFYSKI